MAGIVAAGREKRHFRVAEWKQSTLTPDDPGIEQIAGQRKAVSHYLLNRHLFLLTMCNNSGGTERMQLIYCTRSTGSNLIDFHMGGRPGRPLGTCPHTEFGKVPA